MDSYSLVPQPVNEPVLGYAPGSPEREELTAELERQYAQGAIELPARIGGQSRMPGGESFDVTMPSEHAHVLGTSAESTPQDAQDAIDAALAAKEAWASLDFAERAAIFLRAADLLSGPWRAKLNAATMLGQAKTVQQAEIDSACELIDFLRFNVGFAEQLLENQPESSPGVWNRTDYRPLEGFVYAITPFNFTAIAGNLPIAPALMGNVVIWKPSTTQQYAAHHTMELLRAAGLPDGVINLLPGHGKDISSVALTHRELAGIHFTGSTATFQMLWKTVGENLEKYRTYPRLVGETGGKDFVLAHPSADPEVLKVALMRGAFEYSGQKCSAASRAYVPRSLWDRIKGDLAAETDAIRVGDVRDLSNFTSAVIDKKSFDKLAAAIDAAKDGDDTEIIAGGTYDDSTGWFVRPTIVETTNPQADVMVTEYFGPILGVHVYDDDAFDEILDVVDSTSPYALTGAVISQDRYATDRAMAKLRNAAGNFYINDKPTGAVVGQQPFGGARASGTNDKAGSMWNLIRWVSPRSIKETFVPPTAIDYPHQGVEDDAAGRPD
ncbi:L-glutamate gamma-semialdehyde dehydrogenase [Mariniluteicoccus endophyticus]